MKARHMRNRIHYLLLTVLLGCFLSTFALAVATPGKVPIIKNVGIIPPQWLGDNDSWFGLKKAQNSIDNSFSTIVNNTKRFRSIDNNIVADLWSKPDGRLELEKKYELEAYVALSAIIRDDIVVFTARILGKDFESYLIESEHMRTIWIRSATEEQLLEKITNLTWRLINRLPSDIYVTSIQGRYITISGGQDQGIVAKDKINFRESYISSIHPANGTWLTYKHRKLGSAIVIDARKTTSLAQLTEVSFEGALKVGHGAKVEQLAGRLKFKAKPKEPDFELSKPGSSIIEPPMYTESGKKIERVKPEFGDIPQKPATPRITKLPEAPPEAIMEVDEEDETLEENIDDDDIAGSRNLSPMLKRISKLTPSIKIIPGLQLWNLSGSTTAASAVPMWLANQFEFKASLPKIKNWFTDGSAGLMLGQTGRSNSYFGLWLETISYIEAPSPIESQYIEAIRAGFHLHIKTYRVENEVFGGMNLLTLGPSLGARGGIDLEALGKIDWVSNLNLILFAPLSLSSVGTPNQQDVINNIFGLEWSNTATIRKGRNQWEFGGGLDLGYSTMTLPTTSLTTNHMTLKFIAGMRF